MLTTKFKSISERPTKLKKKYIWKARWKILKFKRRHFSKMLGNYIISTDPIVMGKGMVLVTALDNNLSHMVGRTGPRAITLMFRVKPEFVEHIVRVMCMGSKVCVSGTRIPWVPGKNVSYWVDKYMVLGITEKMRFAPIKYRKYDRATKITTFHFLPEVPQPILTTQPK